MEKNEWSNRKMNKGHEHTTHKRIQTNADTEEWSRSAMTSTIQIYEK